LRSMERVFLINFGLSKYVDFWKVDMCKVLHMK
jgi:hypothetical protein